MLPTLQVHEALSKPLAEHLKELGESGERIYGFGVSTSGEIEVLVICATGPKAHLWLDIYKKIQAAAASELK